MVPGTGGNCRHRTPSLRPAGATAREEEVVLDVSEWAQEEFWELVAADEPSHQVSKYPNPKIDGAKVSLKGELNVSIMSWILSREPKKIKWRNYLVNFISVNTAIVELPVTLLCNF